MMTVIGYTEPMKNKISNLMEIVNELFVLIFTYHMYSFTDFMPFTENRIIVGKVLVYLAIFNIALNILVAIQQNIFNLAWKLKLTYLRTKLRIFTQR